MAILLWGLPSSYSPNGSGAVWWSERRGSLPPTPWLWILEQCCLSVPQLPHGETLQVAVWSGIKSLIHSTNSGLWVIHTEIKLTLKISFDFKWQRFYWSSGLSSWSHGPFGVTEYFSNLLGNPISSTFRVKLRHDHFYPSAVTTS